VLPHLGRDGPPCTVLARGTVKFFALRASQAGAVLPNHDEGAIGETPYAENGIAVARFTRPSNAQRSTSGCVAVSRHRDLENPQAPATRRRKSVNAREHPCSS
jgi:hypothetical protein